MPEVFWFGRKYSVNLLLQVWVCMGASHHQVTRTGGSQCHLSFAIFQSILIPHGAFPKATWLVACGVSTLARARTRLATLYSYNITYHISHILYQIFYIPVPILALRVIGEENSPNKKHWEFLRFSTHLEGDFAFGLKRWFLSSDEWFD